MRMLIVPLLLTGCSNPCVDMCQKMDAWLQECGTTWEVAFENDGWEKIDDCYDSHWEADKSDRKECAQDARKWNNKECY